MSLSDDGNRAYIADPTGRDMAILDTSEIQARKADPQVKEISRVTWAPASIPQNAIPFTEGGHPYVLEFDEYNASTLGSGSPDDVGAARIIDIGDEAHPKVIANLRLQVNQPAEHKEASGDPGAINAAQGYAAHYCNIPTRDRPEDRRLLVHRLGPAAVRHLATSCTQGGRLLRRADRRRKPENSGQASDFAMSQPAFVPERREVWFTDGTSGFYALRVATGRLAGRRRRDARRAHSCSGRRLFAAHVKLKRGAQVRSIRATLNGKKVKQAKRVGRKVRVTVDLRKLTKSVATLRVTVKLKNGRTVKTKRVYHPCTRRADGRVGLSVCHPQPPKPRYRFASTQTSVPAKASWPNVIAVPVLTAPSSSASSVPAAKRREDDQQVDPHAAPSRVATSAGRRRPGRWRPAALRRRAPAAERAQAALAVLGGEVGQRAGAPGAQRGARRGRCRARCASSAATSSSMPCDRAAREDTATTGVSRSPTSAARRGGRGGRAARCRRGRTWSRRARRGSP